MNARHTPTVPPTASAPCAQLLKLADVAAHFSIEMRTVYSWIAAGKLRVLRLSKRCIRVEPAEITRITSEARR